MFIVTVKYNTICDSGCKFPKAWKQLVTNRDSKNACLATAQKTYPESPGVKRRNFLSYSEDLLVAGHIAPSAGWAGHFEAHVKPSSLPWWLLSSICWTLDCSIYGLLAAYVVNTLSSDGTITGTAHRPSSPETLNRISSQLFTLPLPVLERAANKVCKALMVVISK